MHSKFEQMKCTSSVSSLNEHFKIFNTSVNIMHLNIPGVRITRLTPTPAQFLIIEPKFPGSRSWSQIIVSGKDELDSGMGGGFQKIPKITQDEEELPTAGIGTF